jgi:hypothetical protein
VRVLVVTVALVLEGCNPFDAGWGPVAVIDADVSTVVQVSGGTGVLSVGPTCVVLVRESSGDPVTLVWRESEVNWTGSSLLFRNVERPPNPFVALDTGIRVSVSGEQTENPVWIARPHPTCPPEQFTVHEVLIE